MSDSVTYYDVLGVKASASSSEITTAYKQLAKKMHPDVGGSVESMRLLNRAYKVLSDSTTRKEYDASLKKDGSEQFYKKHNYHQPTATDLIKEEQVAVKTIKKAAGMGVLKGLGIAAAGLIITAIGYSMASDGGSYFIFWGLIVWGAWMVIRSWYYFLHPYGPLHSAMDEPGEKYEFYLEKPGGRIRAILIIIGTCLLLFFILSALSSGSSNYSSDTTTRPSPSSSSGSQIKLNNYNRCRDEYTAVSNNLDDIENRMNSYKNSGSTYAYNALVPRQNSLVAEMQSKYDECERLRQTYNSSL